MPTIIDELIVRLGIDASKFRADAEKTQADINRVGRSAVQSSRGLEDSLQKTQESTGKRLKQTEEVGRGAAQQFNKFRVEVAALFATMATGFGFAKFLNDVSKGGADIGRSAVQLGVSAEKLNTWQEAAKRAGGSAESLKNAWSAMTQDFQNRQTTGQSTMLAYLQRLGVEWADAKDPTKMLPIDEIYKKIRASPVWQQMDMPKKIEWGAILGMSPAEVALVSMTEEQLDKLLAHVKRLGVLNDSEAGALAKYQTSLMDLEQSFKRLGTTITVAASGPLKEFIDAITDWISKPENQQLIADKTTEAIKLFRDNIGDAKKFVEDWHVVLEALAVFVAGRWLLMMTFGLGRIGMLVAAIGLGFLAIKNAMSDTPLTDMAPDSPLWDRVPEEEALKYPQSPQSRKRAGTYGENPNPYSKWNPGSWFNRTGSGGQPLADTSMNDIKKGFLDTIAGPESGGRYNVLQGGEEVNDLSRHPNRIGKGGTVAAFGRYQIIPSTGAELSAKYGFTDYQPVTQDKMAWALAQERYRRGGGGDLEADLRAGNKNDLIARILNPTWTSLPGGKESRQSQESFNAALKRNSSGATTPEPSTGLKGMLRGMGMDGWITSAVEPSTRYGGGKQLASNSNVSTSETNINGPITINTQATDADGIAKSLSDRLKRYGNAAPANSGLA